MATSWAKATSKPTVMLPSATQRAPSQRAITVITTSRKPRL